ncbi:unnamed protein product, partial [Protopolystoma xenopodis]
RPTSAGGLPQVGGSPTACTAASAVASAASAAAAAAAFLFSDSLRRAGGSRPLSTDGSQTPDRHLVPTGLLPLIENVSRSNLNSGECRRVSSFIVSNREGNGFVSSDGNRGQPDSTHEGFSHNLHSVDTTAPDGPASAPMIRQATGRTSTNADSWAGSGAGRTCVGGCRLGSATPTMGSTGGVHGQLVSLIRQSPTANGVSLIVICPGKGDALCIMNDEIR